MSFDLLRTEQFLLDRQARPPCPWTASDFWGALGRGDARSLELSACLRKFEPRARVVGTQGGLSLVPEEPEARPHLRWLLRRAPEGSRVRLGLPSSDHNRALSVAARSGANLEGVRVRVGVGKGNVFDIVLGVPSDLGMESSSIEEAFLVYLELTMGHAFVEDWLGEILIEPVPSRKGLTVLSNAGLPPNYPLAELADLLFRGGLGLLWGRRESLPVERWVAFELGRTDEAPFQADRTFVTTCVPEVLGPIFEGVPFASRRFFPEGERLVWFEWGPASSERKDERRAIEERIDEVSRSFGGRGVLGTGFGLVQDYVDALIPFRAEALETLVRATSELIQDGRLCFYDAEHRDLVLRLGPES